MRFSRSKASRPSNRPWVAYEPVWAIGTGKTASPDQAQAVHAFIRNKLAAQDATIADKLRILYGGSVKASNAVELFGMADIDGGLIAVPHCRPKNSWPSAAPVCER